MGKIFRTNMVTKKSWGAYTNTRKIEVESEAITWDKYMLIKGSIPQEDVTITNLCAAYNRAPKYRVQTFTQLRREIVIL